MALSKKNNKEKKSSSVKENKEVVKKNASSNSVKGGSDSEGEGPSIVPYNQKFTDKEYQEYKAFYEDFFRTPKNVKDDKFDAFNRFKKNEIANVPDEPFTGWELEMKDDKGETFYAYLDKQPKPGPGRTIRKVENKIIGYSKNPSQTRELSKRIKEYISTDIDKEKLNFINTKNTEAAKRVASKSSYGQYRRLPNR